MRKFRQFGLLAAKELRNLFFGYSGPLAVFLFVLAATLPFFAGLIRPANGYFSGFVLNIPYISIFVIPILTAGVWSEEERKGTKKILLSLPVSRASLVAGKFVSRLAVFLAMLALCVPFVSLPGVMPEPGVAAASAIMLILFGVLTISAGQFFSGLFSGTVSAYIATTAAMLALNTVHRLPALIALPDWLSYILTHVSFAWHLESASRGILDSGDAFFYLIPSAFFLYVDAMSLARGNERL